MQFIFLFVVASPWWTPGLPSAVHLCFFILFVRPASLSDSVQSSCFLCYICLTFESSLFSVFLVLFDRYYQGDPGQLLVS